MIQYAVASVPITDLRREPAEALPFRSVRDELQESQVLLGEHPVIRDEETDWFNVEAIEQPKHVKQGGWRLIEAVETSEVVKIRCFEARFGVTPDRLVKGGSAANGTGVRFGRFSPSSTNIRISL